MPPSLRMRIWHKIFIYTCKASVSTWEPWVLVMCWAGLQALSPLGRAHSGTIKAQLKQGLQVGSGPPWDVRGPSGGPKPRLSAIILSKFSYISEGLFQQPWAKHAWQGIFLKKNKTDGLQNDWMRHKNCMNCLMASPNSTLVSKYTQFVLPELCKCVTTNNWCYHTAFQHEVTFNFRPCANP